MDANVAFPRQKIPSSKKTEQWKKDTIEAIIGMTTYSPGSGSTYRDLMQQCYEYYNGVIDDDDYTHVLAPYGKERRNFPAKLHNYNIIKPNIDVLIGEKEKRPLRYSVVVTNEDVQTFKEQRKREELLKNLQQHFINELNAMGIPTGQDGEEVPFPEELVETFERSYKDDRAIIGQEILDFITYDLDIKSKFTKGFFHWLVSGCVFTLKLVNGESLHYEMLNPLDVDFDKSPDEEFIEDGDWATVRKMMLPSKVIDFFWEDLTEEEIDKLESEEGSGYEPFFLAEGGEFDRDHPNRRRNIEVIKVYWKSRKKIGFVTFIDEFGQFQEKQVGEKYKKGENEEIEWFWVNEVWEGYRINGNLYKRVRPVEVQRNDLDNESKCKLPINGRKYSDSNVPNISLVMLGMAYQLSYNIYKYRLDNALAKSKDFIVQMDINTIPKGWEMDKWLYYVDAVGISFVDYQKEGVKMNPQHQAVLDMSMRTIQSYLALLNHVQMEWDQLSGVTRQRKGQVDQYDLKGVTEQSIISSSNVTEDFFFKFAQVEQRDLSGLLDYSKSAFINGKKGMYILPDQSHQYFDADGIQHAESNYGVFVSDANKEVRKIEMIQGLSQALAQNGASLEAMVEIIDNSDSFVKIKEKIKEAERNRQQMEEAMREQEMAQTQAQLQLEQVKMENENRQKELDRQNKLRIAQIQQQARLRDNEDISTDTGDDSKSRKVEYDHQEALAELALEKEKHEDQMDLEEKKLRQERRNGRSNGQSKS